MFPATLFDYNGVLIDDENVHFSAFVAALAPLGLTLSEHDYWQRYLGYDDRGAFKAILHDQGYVPADAEIERLVEQKKPHYLELAARGLKTFADAGLRLKELAQHGPVGIVSGALHAEIELGLQVLDVREAVRFVVAAEDTTNCKPDPEGYLLGIEHLRALGVKQPERALVIEDSLAGIEAAKRAGLCCVGVAHSYAAAELERAGADLVLTSLAAMTVAQLRQLHATRFG